MTNQQRIQKVKEYIQKEIPEIMELKFGCEVYLKERQGDTVRCIGYCESNIMLSYDKGDRERSLGFIRGLQKRDFEIIGRPITLPDVLRVIEKEHILIDKDNWGVSIGGYTVAELLENWNLKENFNNQSEETKLFICDLLDIK